MWTAVRASVPAGQRSISVPMKISTLKGFSVIFETVIGTRSWAVRLGWVASKMRFTCAWLMWVLDSNSGPPVCTE